jgi:hypothetical protein
MITTAELATWCQLEEAAVAADDYALMVIEYASELCRSAAGRPDWDTPATTPVPAKLICLVVARRTYLNPDQEIAQAVAGGPSVRMLDAAGMGMALTDDERAELERLGAIDNPNPSPAGDLWVLPLTRGTVEKSLYLADNSGSDWLIPFLDPDKDPYYFPTLEDSP